MKNLELVMGDHVSVNGIPYRCIMSDYESGEFKLSPKDTQFPSYECEITFRPYSDMSQKEKMRQGAITALELTKGFTPEQRQMMGNLLTSIEEMANNVLKLT